MMLPVVPIKKIPGMNEPCSMSDKPPSKGLVCTHLGKGKYTWAPPKIKPNVKDLNPVFKPVAERLHKRIKESGLPLVMVDAVRSPERQIWAMKSGGSKVGPDNAAHVHGFGMDFHLAPWYVEKHNLRGGTDHGLNYTGDPRTRVVKPLAYAIWAAFGSLIDSEFPELRWGGNFGRKGKIFGWDVYHVEQWSPPYTMLIKQGQGWPLLQKVKKKAKKNKFMIVGAVAIGVSGYFLYKKSK